MTDEQKQRLENRLYEAKENLETCEHWFVSEAIDVERRVDFLCTAVEALLAAMKILALEIGEGESGR